MMDFSRKFVDPNLQLLPGPVNMEKSQIVGSHTSDIQQMAMFQETGVKFSPYKAIK